MRRIKQVLTNAVTLNNNRVRFLLISIWFLTREIPRKCTSKIAAF